MSRGGTPCSPTPINLAPCPLLQQPLSSAQLRRNRDKLVALLEEGQYSVAEDPAAAGGPSPQASPGAPPGLAGEEELLRVAVEEAPEYRTGRITIHCTAARYWGVLGARVGRRAGRRAAAALPAGRLACRCSQQCCSCRPCCAPCSYDLKGLREHLEKGGYS